MWGIGRGGNHFRPMAERHVSIIGRFISPDHGLPSYSLEFTNALANGVRGPVFTTHG